MTDILPISRNFMKNSFNPAIRFLAVISLCVFLPEIGRSQGPPTIDSASVIYQCADTGLCGGKGCNKPCAVISVENLSYNYQIVDVSISCDSGYGMTICKDWDDNGLSWLASCPLGMCVSSCDFQAPGGNGIPQDRYFHIEECGCCKVSITFTFKDPASSHFTDTLDICGKCPD